MIINFVGTFGTGMAGETADEVHLTRNLEALGSKVQRVPRDIWKAYCDGDRNKDWEDRLPIKADFNIVCKWHHFNKSEYVTKLKEASGAPVFYWVWDYMWDYPATHPVDWHQAIAEASDVVLTNEGGLIPTYQKLGINAYYFPFDCADEKLKTYFNNVPHLHVDHERDDVIFTGTYLGQGDRVEWLKKINSATPVKIYSWNHEEWQKQGFEAHPAVYGEEFNKAVAESKICLQFSVNDHCWGYWSNRVGKVLLARGFLLARYAPGMELFLKDGVAYFNSPEEAIEKIKFYLANPRKRWVIAERGSIIGREHFTSEQRCKELLILLGNYGKIYNG